MQNVFFSSVESYPTERFELRQPHHFRCQEVPSTNLLEFDRL
jgi:hypothetical protein